MGPCKEEGACPSLGLAVAGPALQLVVLRKCQDGEAAEQHSSPQEDGSLDFYVESPEFYVLASNFFKRLNKMS